MTAEQRAILEKQKGKKTITQYIIQLIMDDQKNK
jgi:folate-dependent phosphoribosylglycinamide formyltransferase PurN